MFKKILASIFMVLINYYMLAFFIGTLLTFVTILVGSISFLIVLSISLITLVVCILYQIKRRFFSFISIGEVVLGNYNKLDIFDQTKLFAITRIPIFLVVVIVLAVNGNLLDGLSDGQRYTFSNFFLFLIIFLTVYNGIKNFFLKADLLSVMVFAGGLLFIAFAFKKHGLYEFITI